MSSLGHPEPVADRSQAKTPDVLACQSPSAKAEAQIKSKAQTKAQTNAGVEAMGSAPMPQSNPEEAGTSSFTGASQKKAETPSASSVRPARKRRFETESESDPEDGEFVSDKRPSRKKIMARHSSGTDSDEPCQPQDTRPPTKLTKRKAMTSVKECDGEIPGSRNESIKAPKPPTADSLTVTELEYMVEGATKRLNEARESKRTLEAQSNVDAPAIKIGQDLVENVQLTFTAFSKCIDMFDSNKEILNQIKPKCQKYFNDVISIFAKLDGDPAERKKKYDQALKQVTVSISKGKDAAKRAREEKVAQAQAAIDGHQTSLSKWQQKLNEAQDKTAPVSKTPAGKPAVK